MMKKSFLCLFIIAIVISGCSKYGYVRLNYPSSPNVILPDNITTIAMVNRSLTKEQDQKKKMTEAIKTGEIAGSDKIASDECLKGVFDRVNGLNTINIVIPSQTRFYGTGTRETPELLNWDLVQAICDSTNADALLVLETFDSNSDLLLSTVTNQLNSVINNGKLDPSMPGQIRMNVLCFWRLYDPSTKTIIDQYQSTSNMVFNASGPGLYLPPPDALPNTAYNAGQEYISRFLPSYYKVQRDLYKRGKRGSKQQFLAAFRHSEVADWEGAVVIWKQIVENGRWKNRGRACLNIAVAYEVLGNTDLALIWAKKAYQDYNNKLARDYANILIQRQNIE